MHFELYLAIRPRIRNQASSFLMYGTFTDSWMENIKERIRMNTSILFREPEKKIWLAAACLLYDRLVMKNERLLNVHMGRRKKNAQSLRPLLCKRLYATS